mgnify:CR=1 FL=1
MKANNSREISSNIRLILSNVDEKTTDNIKSYIRAIDKVIENERESQKELTNIAIYLKGQSDPIIKAMGEKMLQLI